MAYLTPYVPSPSVDGALSAQLCDAALSAEVFPGDYTSGRPLRWLPLEALDSKAQQSPQGDVVGVGAAGGCGGCGGNKGT